MELLFWNIGGTFSRNKTDFIGEVVMEHNPEILVIAEGTPKKENCRSLVDAMAKIGYRCFYQPLFLSEDPIIGHLYDYNDLGLKVFIKTNSTLLNTFAFPDQQCEGRIVHLRVQFNKIDYSYFLIHNMSLRGDDMDQSSFMVELSRFIAAKLLVNPEDKIIVVGDFNAEPWSDLFRKSKYINSFFYKKALDFYYDKQQFDKVPRRLYYNPVYDHIQGHVNTNLIGTFYSKKFISILDYALFLDNINNYSFEIIDKISNTSLIVQRNSKHLLVNDFDHLPIKIKLN